MRYMILITSDEQAVEGQDPGCNTDLFAAYARYTEDLKKAGVLLGGEALQPSKTGTRISTRRGKRNVTDGPFTETKEIIGGYFLVQTRTKEEAVEWAARCPAAQSPGSFVELREVLDLPG